MLQNIIIVVNKPTQFHGAESIWEANCSLATEEIPHVLWKLQVPYSLQ
jgi:hypothetical protein